MATTQFYLDASNPWLKSSIWIIQTGEWLKEKVLKRILGILIAIILLPFLVLYLVIFGIALGFVAWYVKLLKKQDFSKMDYEELYQLKKANVRILKQDNHGKIYGIEFNIIKELVKIDNEISVSLEKEYANFFTSQEARRNHEQKMEQLTAILD